MKWTTQQTQNICITFIQRRPNVFDVGPTLYKCYTNVLCLLGTELQISIAQLLSAYILYLVIEDTRIGFVESSV